jgi:hypothetical protein
MKQHRCSNCEFQSDSKWSVKGHWERKHQHLKEQNGNALVDHGLASNMNPDLNTNAYQFNSNRVDRKQH